MDILKIAMIGMAGVCLAIPLKSYKAEYGMLISLGTCVCIFIYLAAEICKDAGYGAVGSQIELFGKVSILFVSMPVLLALLQTVGDFL